MCNYMVIKNGKEICEPYGDLCLFCVTGNSRRYNEICEKEKRDKNEN